MVTSELPGRPASRCQIFSSLFPVQQTTGRIGDRVKYQSFFRVGNKYAECEKQHFFPPDWGMLRRSTVDALLSENISGESSQQTLLLDFVVVVFVVVVVVFTLKAVPVSTQYSLTSVLVQLTRTPSVFTG